MSGTGPGFTPDGAYIPQPQDLVDVYPQRTDDIPTPLVFRTPLALVGEAIGSMFLPPGPGVVISNGTVLEDAILAPGLSLDLTTRTLENTGVLSLGSATGVIAVGGGLVMAMNTLSATAGLTITAGTGIAIAGTSVNETISVGGFYEYGTISWGGGAVVADGTITIGLYWPFATHITRADYAVGAGGGSTTLEVRIDGSAVTGLSAVAITTAGNAAASGANAVAAGAHIVDCVLSGTTGTISDGGAITITGTIG